MQSTHAFGLLIDDFGRYATTTCVANYQATNRKPVRLANP
jgi:hypothetical protein